jgi:hypothetical protein
MFQLLNVAPYKELDEEVSLGLNVHYEVKYQKRHQLPEQAVI